MHRNRIRPLAAAALAVVAAVSATSAYAGTSYRSYSTTVGKFNGKAYTASQTKSINSRAGDLTSQSVGGNYKVDARMLPGGTGVSGVTDNQEYKLNNSIGSGASTRVEFNNGVFTRVDVQVSGTWRSN